VRGEPKRVAAFAQFADMPERRFPVTLKSYATEADPTTQTYEVVLALKSRPPGLTLLPGMSVTVLPFAPTAAKSGPAGSALSIPLTAVVSDATGGTFVWVVGAGGQVTRSNVVLGDIRGGDVTVASGLNAGERIVTAGVSALREGMKVRPLDAR